MSIGLQVLRAKVVGFHVAGKAIHRRIRKAKGLKRQGLWLRKRNLGEAARYHMIAYGLLRGIHYERIESCGSENRPDPGKIHELMLAHAGWAERRNITIERVKELLSPAERPPLQPTSGPKTANRTLPGALEKRAEP